MKIIEGVHIATGQPLYEVIKEDGYYTHMAYFAHLDEAECYIKRIQQERKVRVEGDY